MEREVPECQATHANANLNRVVTSVASHRKTNDACRAVCNWQTLLQRPTESLVIIISM